MNKPDFFIVGAPKCGTTSLYHYLKDHLTVFMPSIKEPCFFADDFPNYRKVHSEVEYLKLFEDVSEKDESVGEASVWYLYSRNALENIHDFNEDARIIAMIRNPVEVVYSLHHQNYYSNIDDVANFEKAWNLREDRKRGESIPSTCPAPEHLFYEEAVKFGDQLERLFDIFPREQVKVIVFDDFVEDTEGVFLETLDFLGVEDKTIPDLSPYNTSHRWKVPLVGKITTELPRRVRFILRPLKQLLGIQSFRVLSWLEQLNTTTDKRDPLSASLINELQNTFKEDIRKTGTIIDRDLSHWFEEEPDKLETGADSLD